MFTCECLLAAALLTSPPEAPRCSGAAEVLGASLLTLAVDLEILDPRETSFLFVNDCAGDCAMLAGRARDMNRMPALDEGLRFPDRRTVNDFLALNRAYRNQLTSRLAFDLVHAEELRTAILETDQLYQIWDAVRDARCEYYYVPVRRQSLQLLRDLVGADAFVTGALPPHVPLWQIPRTH